MKKGAGDDPFAEDPEPVSTSEEGEGQDTEGEAVLSSSTQGSRGTQAVMSEATTDSAPTNNQGGGLGADLPYLARRSLKGKSVKADRDQVPFFLREEVQEGERTLRREVEDALGQEVNKTDLREAAYVFAQRNPDGIADILREWGVEYLD